MEQYMSKTREDYGSGVTRPSINQDTHFELKGQFLKELRDNTFSGSEHEDKWHNGTSSKTKSVEISDGLAAIQVQLNNLRREIKKVYDKVYGAQVGCELCKGPYYTKDCPQKEEGKTLEEAYYTQFDATYQPGGKAQDVKILDAYDHIFPQKEKDPRSFTLPCFIHNICFDKALVDLGASVSVMPFSIYTNLGLGILSHTWLTIELVGRTIKQPRGIAENMLVRIGFTIIDDDDITKDVVLDMKFCKKYASCQMFMRKFAQAEGCARIED
nr:hypothetical protein [Tanacetum cinerariifolium]GEY30561.1 hypothetical protein [Tanacetum cinerariifolium]